MKILLVFFLGLASISGYSQTLEERVDELEMNAFLNSITFSGEFVVRMDHVYKPYISQTKRYLEFGQTGPQIVQRTQEFKGKSFNMHREMFSLNINAKISDSLAFYGRVTATKRLNNFVILDSSPSTSGEGQARTFGGTTMHLERAYFNWKMLDNLSLSVGRLPTIEGGPYHITLGEAPRGTYPQLAYAAQLDGYALTYTMGGLTFRILYHPLSSYTEQRSSSGYLYQPEWNSLGKRLRTDNELLTGMIEYSTDSLGFARYFTFVSQYFLINNLLTDDLSIDTVDLDGSVTGTPGSIYEYEISLPLALYYKQHVNYIEMNGIAKTSFNLALTHSSTTSISKGVAGFLTNEKDGETTGAAMLVTASYKLPIAAIDNPIAGLEYFSSDKGYQFFNGSNWDPISFLSARGTGSHLFWNQKLTDGLKLRIGHMMLDRKYSTGEFRGEPTELTGDQKGTTKTTYAEFRLAF